MKLEASLMQVKKHDRFCLSDVTNGIK